MANDLTDDEIDRICEIRKIEANMIEEYNKNGVVERFERFETLKDNIDKWTDELKYDYDETPLSSIKMKMIKIELCFIKKIISLLEGDAIRDVRQKEQIGIEDWGFETKSKDGKLLEISLVKDAPASNKVKWID